MNNNMFYDKDFRQKLLTNPKTAMSELNSDFIQDVEVLVKKNSKHLIYFVMPMDATIGLEGNLGSIQAAAKVGCAGSIACASTASSVGSACTTFGSASSAGSASTTSTAK